MPWASLFKSLVMKKISIGFLLVLLFGNVSAQQLLQEIVDPQYQNSSLLALGKGKIRAPFWFKDFYPGKIKMAGDKYIDNVKLNIDTYSNKILAKQDDKPEVVVDNKNIEGVIIETDKGPITFERIFDTDLKNKRFYEVLFKGQTVTFYKLNTAIFKKATQESSSGYHSEEQTKDRFISDTQYFLFFNNLLHEVKLNKKQVSTLLLQANQSQKELIQKSSSYFNNAETLKLFLSENNF